MNTVKFRYLSEEDMINAGVLDMNKCVSVMEETFRLLYLGDYRMGGASNNEHGIRVSFPTETVIEGMPLAKPDYRFMAMPAYLGGRFHSFGIKTYGSNPDNSQLGLPRSILMMSLLDAKTGVPQAYMSANLLSAMRTGAVTGLGAKYLCNELSSTITIIGPGTMARFALDAFMAVRNTFTRIKIKGRGKKSIEKYIQYLNTRYPQITDVSICETYEEACRESDLIYFGTTNAARFEDNPYIEEDWVKEGAVVISASSLLVNPSFLNHCTLIADNYKMYEGWGHGNELPTQKTVSTLLGMGYYDAVCEGMVHKDDIIDMGEIITNNINVRKSEKQIFMYSVGGMPIEDVSWGYEIYHNAIERSIGKELILWKHPELMK